MNIKLKKQREEEKWKEKDSQPHFPFLKCNYKLTIFELHWNFMPLLNKSYFSFYIVLQVFFSVFFILQIWAWKLVVLRYPDFPDEAYTQILYTSNGWFKTKLSTVSVSKNPKMALCGLKKHSRDYKNANFEFDLNNHDRNSKLFQPGFCTTNIKTNFSKF